MLPVHLHSYYTFLNGSLGVEEIAKLAALANIRYLPLTDSNGIYGLVQFMNASRTHGIVPVLGMQFTFSEAQNDYVLLFALDKSGFETICHLSTQKKLDDTFTFESLLTKSSKGVCFLTPDKQYYKKLRQVYPNLTFFEWVIENVYKPFDINTGHSLTEDNISYVRSIPVVCKDRADHELHKILSAIRLKKTLGTLQKGDFAPEYHSWEMNLKMNVQLSDSEIRFQSLLAGANVDVELGKIKFPRFPLPEGTSAETLLWKLCFEGLSVRYKQVNDELRARMEHELQVIHDLDFDDYFLVVWDIVREAKRRGMMIVGRGSAANSLVSYCLGFTEVDPMTNGFYFERFLNEYRTSPPDVDLDFSWQERDEIIKYVFTKYGYDRVAMICTTVTFRARSAFREVAKVFGFSNEEISKYSKFIPWSSAANLSRISELYPESRNLPFDKEPWRTVVQYASQLAGYPRHLGIHPGGILIAPSRITDFVALEYAKNKGVGLIVTQLDMYSIEDMGLVKIDLLSQRSLGVVRKTLAQISQPN